MSDEDHSPYEKWSRSDYRMAYEESEGLRNKLFEEVGVLRERVKYLEEAEIAARAWAQHSITLGHAINQLVCKQ